MGSVSRETPPVPDVARGVFGSGTDTAVAYAALLATDGVTRGLIGPREAPRLWERHLLNCAVVSDLIAEGSDVCDIGSGAGLPGLVLAIRRSDLRVTLVEPLLRRTTFLAEVVDRLALDNVAVVRDRAEALHGSADFAVVTSRAVAPLPRLLDWSMPLVRQGGELVAMKGAGAAEEVRTAAKDLVRWGGGPVEVLTLGSEVVNPPTTVIRVESARPSALGYGSRTDGPGPRTKRGRDPKGRGRPT